MNTTSKKYQLFCPLHRPFAKSESNRAGIKNADDNKSKFIPYQTIVEKSIGHIGEWNNSEHPKHPGKSRWEVFLTTQHPKLSPINWRGILPFIGQSTRSSVKAGQLRLQGGEWLLGSDNRVTTGSELLNYLKAVNDKDIMLQWLDSNDGNVLQAHVCTLDGRYICQAIRKPAYNTATLEQTDNDKAVKTLLSKYVATVTGYINSEKSKSEGITTIDNSVQFKPSIAFTIPGTKTTYAAIETETANLGSAYQDDDEVFMPKTTNTGSSWRQKFLNNQ